MSYEGYSQFLCEEGHKWNVNCWVEADEIEENKCPICEKPAIWRNMVNLTNGSFDEDDKRIDGYVELQLKDKHTVKCEHCQKEHLCECSMYKLPRKGIGQRSSKFKVVKGIKK